MSSHAAHAAHVAKKRRFRPRQFRVPAALLLWLALPLTGWTAVAQDNAQKLFQTAVTAQQRGDSTTAIAIYQSLLRQHPGVLAVRANLAGLLAETGRSGEAIEAYRSALRLAPTDRTLHLGLAYAYGQRGEPTDLHAAVQELEALHASDPADEQATMLLGDAYSREGKYAQAASMLAPLEKTHPEDRDVQWLLGLSLVRSGNSAEGVQRLDRLVAHGASDKEVYLLAGEARLALQQFDLAKADADAALKVDPQDPKVQILLGRILEHTGDYAAAEVALQTGLGKDAGNFDGQYSLGALLLFERKLPDAAEHLRQALRLEPNSAEARYKLAMTEQEQGQPEAALADLRTVTHERPEWLEAQAKLLALLYRRHDDTEAARVKQTVEKLTAAQQPNGAKQDDAPPR